MKIYKGDMLAAEEDIKKKKDGRGGKRVAGPGKSLGRPKVHAKRRKTSFSLSEPLFDKLEEMANWTGKTRSRVIEQWIKEKYPIYCRDYRGKDKNP